MQFFTALQSFWSVFRRLPRFIRYLGLLAIGILYMVLVAASPVAPQQPVTLQLLMSAPDVPPWTKYMVKAFEASHPNIRLQIVEGPNNVSLLEDMYTTAFLLGDSPYDLVTMDVIWTPKFAAAGWLVDLTEQFSPQDLAAFSPTDVNGGRYQGRLYRIPVRSDVGMLYYRKDLLEQAGLAPPKTFEDIATLSKVLQDRQAVRWGYLWQGKQYEGLSAMFVEVLKGFGGFWVNPETLEVGLDRPEAIRAVQFLQDTINQGISPPGVTTYVEEDTRRLFQNGQAAFLRNWPYAWPLLNEETSPVKGKVAIMPMVPAAGQQGGSCLGGWGLGIAKTSKHPKEALEAIRFLTSEPSQQKFVMEAGYVPSRQNLFNKPQITAKYSYYPELFKVVQNAVLRPPIAQYAQTSDILQRYLSAALTNQKSPEQAMKAAAEETRRLLAAGKKSQK
ncbi:ABC transporter substrate-binding protein [Leptodesmis sp.]|uniref:ABC transporter substrate-binding protein n=1 Tax=Leptodesmis sp. TaxID=3100501 RepID=UPI0040535960